MPCGSICGTDLTSFEGCNPPDDIFLVALPFKLLGVKYIFDHHDANPELYVSKYGKQGDLYKILVMARETYVPVQRCSHGDEHELPGPCRQARQLGSAKCVRRAQRARKDKFKSVPPIPLGRTESNIWSATLVT